MQKLAAIVDDLGPSQKSFYLIKEFNKAAISKDMSISVFYGRPTIPVTVPHFSCKNMAFLSGYDGVAIATNLSSANTLLRSHNNSKKYLYLWDIEWLTMPVNFAMACNILLDNRLKLIARSESHATVINHFCNKQLSGIVDNWNLDELLKITKE
tara:strand:+ start:805 stop:1266 length:462 start_codon:yes stop_codon:yes gene_type:complete